MLGEHQVRTTAALAQLLKESAEWRQFFRQCCETGALRLRSQAWQFRAALVERGHEDLRLQDVEDALLTIARKVLPRSPAAAWDPEWAAELIDDALARLAERYGGLPAGERGALDISGQEAWEERMHASGQANDPVAFREALRGWERARAGALKAAKAELGERSGAA